MSMSLPIQISGRVKRVLVTASSNGIASLIKLLVSIISVPLLINYLGTEKFGAVATINSMVIWLSTIADGGGGLSLKNELVKEMANDQNNTKLSELVSSGFFAVFCASVTIALIASLAIEFLPWQKLLNLGGEINSNEIKNLILIAAWAIIITMIFSLPRAIYSSLQKEYLFAPWAILGSLIGFLLLWLAIFNKLSLLYVGSALLVGTALGMVCGTLWFQLTMRNFRISFAKINGNVIKSLIRPGIIFFILQLAAILIFQTDIFIVNYFLGQNMAAIYSVHFQLFVYFQIFSSLIIGPFWPALGEAFYKGQYTWFKKIIKLLLLSLSALFILYCLVVGILGSKILALWTHHHIAWDPKLGWSMMVYNLILINVSVLMMTLNSVGITGSQMKIVIIQAILNILLSVSFVHLYGAVGVVWGSILSYMLTVVWYMPLKLNKFLLEWAKI